MLRSVILTLSVCSPLSAQVLGAGYQVARSNQTDMRQSGGLGLRLRFAAPVDLRYDYLASDGQRFDSPCGGFVPPDCGPETINYSSRLHSVFIAARARLVSRGSFQLFVAPEVGLASGTISKRSAATGAEGASATASFPGVGAALELSASGLGGTALGVWIGARVRHFMHPGTMALDSYEPHRELDWIRSVEVGVTFAFGREQ